MKYRLTLLTLAVIFFGFSGSGRASTLFFDNFESGSLSSARWVSGSQGAVAADPLQGDFALQFVGLQAGGDLLSTVIGNLTGSYILSFDYLGTCGYQDCGGFIGHEPLDVWDFGSQASYPTTASPSFLIDDGTWHHYSISFLAGTSISLQLEDYSGSGGVAGDAWFDNILVTDAAGPTSVSEPTPLILLGAGLVGLWWHRSRSGLRK